MIPDGHTVVGQIVGVFGIHGAVKVQPLTDFPERFEPEAVLYLKGKPHKVLKTIWHKDQARVQLEGITNPEDAAELRWQHLTVPAEKMPKLGRWEFMTRDLIGCQIVENGQVLGIVERVDPGTMYDLIYCDGAIIPAIREFIKKVDLKAKIITVELIDGMRPGETAEEVR